MAPRPDAIDALDLPDSDVWDTPAAVANVDSDLRQHLAEKCEPPVEVSDRRMIKAAHLLRVSALTNGRTAVNESDCMLLQHILWDRPAERQLVFDWLLGHFPAGTLDPTSLGRPCSRRSGDRTPRSDH